VNGCHVLTITDEYGDGMFGSQWGSCDADGNYVFTSGDGAVIVAMGEPDYGDAISHNFCLPVVPGCTDAGACNFYEEANADDGSCYSTGDPCDDGDEGTVLDAFNDDCECTGVPPVPGCLDDAACNFNAAANVDDGSCFYVAQGTITGAQTATDLTTESYSYDGNAEHTYAWTVNGGSIQGESSGVGLLSVDVLWSSTGSGLVSVTETDTSGCSGEVALEIDLLVNAIGEFEMLGLALFPNPVQDVLTLSMQDVVRAIERLELVDIRGQVVRAWPVVDVLMTLEVQDLAMGMYTLRIGMGDGTVVSAPVVIQR
jgi:hypothetical protein